MKKIINKTVMGVILAFSMVLALLGGIFFARHNSVAEAASPATVTSTIDKTAYFPGDQMKYTVTISTADAGVYHSVTLRIGILNEAKNGFDATASSYFEFSNFETTAPTWDNSDDGQFDDTSSMKGTYYEFSLSKDSTADGLASSEAIELTFDVEVKTGTPLGNYRIGVLEAQACFVRTINGRVTTTHTLNDTSATVNTVASFEVKQASNNNNLSGLKVGQGDDDSKFTEIDLEDPSFNKDNISVIVTDPSLPLSVLPTTEESGAKVTLKPGDIAVDGGDIGKIAVPASGEVTIVVTAENGDEKEYKLKVNVVGAMLTALTVNTDSSTTGITKVGLKETFASATTEYTVYVPSDATNITFNATVSNGHHELTKMDLFGASGYTLPTEADSGVDFAVSNVADGNTLTITCKAQHGTTNSTKDYKITFDVVDVDATIKTLSAVGATTNKAFTNEADIATDEKVDYYFFVLAEPNGESNVTVEANSASAASITLDGAAYTAATKLAAGQHTVKVEAEAGNTATYTFILKNKISLKLKSTAEIDFIKKRDVASDDGTYEYIQTYKKAGMVHGVDDYLYERVVVGKITEGTTINEFLANFESDQLSNIRLYKHYGEKMVELGQPATGHTAAELNDADNNAVGTGWYMEYVVNGTVEEKIYLSVLGDLDGDGVISTYDISLLIGYVGGTSTSCLDNLESYLAAMFMNFGTISAGDIAQLGVYYMGDGNDDYDAVFADM